MSINELEKTFEDNSLVYYNINNIIECICLTKLFSIYKGNRKKYNSIFESFYCNKIQIITIYDRYKNIIYKSKQINIDIYGNLIKINEILKKLKKKCIYFLKLL